VFSKVNDKSKTDFAVKQESTVENEEENSIMSIPKPEASLATSTVGQGNNTSNDCSEDQGTTSERDNNTRFVPREPRDDRQPGAFRQDGRNAREVLDDYDWEGTHSDSDTQLIEVPAEVPDPDEVSRMVEQGLAEWERNVVDANVIINSEEAPDEGTNKNFFMKRMVQHLCDSRKKQMILAITAIIALTCVGVLLRAFRSQKMGDSKSEGLLPTLPPTATHMPSLPPTATPTSPLQSPTSLYDESSSSLAKQLSFVPRDESKCCLLLCHQFWFVFIVCTLMFLIIFPSTASLKLCCRGLTGTIPSEVSLLTKLSELSVIWFLVVMIVLSCVFHCPLMLACHFHSTAYLDLNDNSLMGMIPSQLGSLTKLSKSSVVWLLILMIVLSCHFHCTLMLACHCVLVIFHSTAELYLSGNSLTGTIPSEGGLMSNLSKSSVVWLLVLRIVLSCVFHCTLMLACHFSFYSLVGSHQQSFDGHDSKSDCLDVEFV
jgi:hypothetical protein